MYRQYKQYMMVDGLRGDRGRRGDTPECVSRKTSCWCIMALWMIYLEVGKEEGGDSNDDDNDNQAP